MTRSPVRYVVDASVGIKLFVEEEFSEQAYALFSHLAAEPSAELYVPDLFYIECTTILLKYTRRFGRSLEDSQADLADLGRLALRITSTADLMERSLLLAKKFDLSAYDACYAVLAQQLEIPLVSADRPLAEKLNSAVFIGNVDISMWQEE
jgi:predicted nucleic acid-binding protein